MSESLYIPDLLEENENGVFARHPVRSTLPHAVAVTNESRADAFNTLRKPLITVACAALKEYNFDFDSSFIRREAEKGFQRLATLVRHYPGCPLSLFGHTDPVGEPAYNKWLSERRAKSVYAVLIRSPDLWEELYDPNKRGLATGDIWGLRMVQVMLDAHGFPPGNTEGKEDEATREAIRAFEAAELTRRNGETIPAVSPTGKNTKALRLRLYPAYMDHICHDDNDAEFKLTADRFLGAGKQTGAYQGCSEFNPQLLQSKDDEDRWKKEGQAGKEERNAANAPNRRVVIFLYAKGSKIDPAKWPCPAAANGIQKCIDHFWSDGKKRRETLFQSHIRKFGATVPESAAVLEPPNPQLAAELRLDETTFACRFYHGQAVHSPCERDLKMYVLQLQVDGLTVQRADRRAQHSELVPLARRRFVMRVGETPDAPLIRGRTTEQGIIGIPLFDDEGEIDLKIDAYTSLVFPDTGKDEPEQEGAGNLDTAAFRDENQFVPLPLAAGALLRLTGRSTDDPNFDPDEPRPERDEMIEAVKQRLFNLGYGAGTLPWEDTRFREYLRTFQEQYQLEAAEERGKKIGQATIDKLKELHEPRARIEAP